MKHLLKKLKTTMLLLLATLVGASVLALVDTTSAFAVGNSYTVRSVYGGYGGAKLIRVEGPEPDNEIIDTYCVEMDVYTYIDQGGYQPVNWQTSGIPNLAKVTWILNNSYPAITLEQLQESSGIVGLVDHEDEAIAMTQEAIWHFTNEDHELDLVGAQTQRAFDLYNYLISKANEVTDMEEPTVLPIISVPAVQFVEDLPTSPIVITNPSGNSVKLKVTGSEVALFYEGGVPVNLDAVESGRPFYVKPGDETAPGSIKLEVLESVTVSSGVILRSEGYQTLISAESFKKYPIPRELNWGPDERIDDISVRKEWEGGENDRPESVEIALYGQVDGEEEKELRRQVVTADADGKWEYTFTDLRKHDKNGEIINYRVGEVSVDERYLSSDPIIDNDGVVIITNTYQRQKMNIVGTKKWSGDESIKMSRPDIKLALVRYINPDDPNEEPEIVSTKHLRPSDFTGNIWQVEWKDVWQTDEHGNRYVYMVKEMTFLPNYESKQTGAWEVTNCLLEPGRGGSVAPMTGVGVAVHPVVILFAIISVILGLCGCGFAKQMT